MPQIPSDGESWCRSPFRNDWEFESCFAQPPDSSTPSMGGSRQIQVLHRFRVGEFVWHVCWVDSSDYYGHGFYRYDAEEGRFFLCEEPAYD